MERKMRTLDRIEALMGLREGWLEQTAAEKGKTRENGWLSWELAQAQARYDLYVAKAQSCQDEINRLKELYHAQV
jgi:chloramphenicol 3-O-phosphotransferase